MSKNITTHNYQVARQERKLLKGHSSFVVWFTGLSGSGKSTLANAIEMELLKREIHTYSLDGDNIRLGINKDLGFDREDRHENLRRIAEIAKLFVDSGTVVLASFVSPLESDRKLVKEIIGKKDFVEVFVNTPLEECERRDVKGLYKKARAGEIPNFTGINSPYEPPTNSEIVIKGKAEGLEESKMTVFNYLRENFDLK